MEKNEGKKEGVSESDIKQFNKIIKERSERNAASSDLARKNAPIKTVGNTPMPTAGSKQPHGYGHTASQRDGVLRLSGNPKAHRIGKR